MDGGKEWTVKIFMGKGGIIKDWDCGMWKKKKSPKWLPGFKIGQLGGW